MPENISKVLETAAHERAVHGAPGRLWLSIAESSCAIILNVAKQILH
jgi:hypothetical protein